MNKNTLPFSEKYRPRIITELVLDKIILNKINNIILYKNLPNIIFTGKSGVGKTSSIHCIAKAIYSRNNIHEAVLELNASDDRGIKSVQETIINFCKKKVIFEENYAQHKLLILDEADNITPKAQRLINLLMEKYPQTRFAFICNNSADIIESIQSRCVIIRFTNPPQEYYLNRLKLICINEKINYDDNSLLYLFDVSQKDIRQAINILELTFTCYNIVNVENINKICDIPSKNILENLLKNILNNDVVGIATIINQFKNEGYYSMDVLLHFIQYLKNKTSNNPNFEDIRISLIDTLSNYSYIMSKSSTNYLILTSAFLSCI
jgi:replication factor C subunit 2/4